MTDKHLNKSSNSFVIRKMQILMSLQFYLTPFTKARKKLSGQYLLMRIWRERNTPGCWWACKLKELLWNSIWRFLRKLEIDVPEDTTILLLGIHPKGT